MAALWDLPGKEAFMDNSEPQGTWGGLVEEFCVNTHGSEVSADRDLESTKLSSAAEEQD